MFPTIRKGSSKAHYPGKQTFLPSLSLIFSNIILFIFFSSRESDLNNSTGVEFLLQCSINDIMSTHKSHPL